jgi:hypothetical protein
MLIYVLQWRPSWRDELAVRNISLSGPHDPSQDWLAQLSLVKSMDDAWLELSFDCFLANMYLTTVHALCLK